VERVLDEPGEEGFDGLEEEDFFGLLLGGFRAAAAA